MKSKHVKQEEKRILVDVIHETLRKRYYTFVGHNTYLYLDGLDKESLNTQIGYLFDKTTSMFHEVKVVKFKEVKSFLWYKTKFKDKIQCGYSGEFTLYTDENKQYYFYLDYCDTEDDPDIVGLPYSKYRINDYYFYGIPSTLYREYLKYISDVEGGIVIDDIIDSPFWTYPPFTNYDNYTLLSIIIEYGQDKVRLVKNKNITRYLSVRVIVDERLGHFTIITPKRYKGEQLSNMNNAQLLHWAFNNCEFVPFVIKKERIVPNGHCSHQWSHIADSDIAPKLESYLKSVKHDPVENVYYFVKTRPGKGGTARYYLERDIIMSPRKRRKKKNK